MATNEDFFQFSSRWHELRNLAEGDPENEILTDRLVALLEERDKELEHFLQNRVTSSDVVAGSAVGPRMIPFYVAARWYRAAQNADPDASTSVTSNRVYYMPFVAPYAMTITDLAVDVTTSGGNIRLGIFDNDDAGIWKPGSLAATLGTISVGAGGGQELNSLSHAITAGAVVWFAYQSDTTRTMSVLGPESSPSSGLLNSGTNTPTRAAYTSDTYASGLPDPAGTLVFDAAAGVPSFRFKFT